MNVLDGYWETISKSNSGIDGAESTFTKDVVHTVRSTELSNVEESQKRLFLLMMVLLNGRRRRGARCRRHSYRLSRRRKINNTE